MPSKRYFKTELANWRNDIDYYVVGNILDNPDPVLDTEGSSEGIKFYDAVARDSHVASVLQTRALAVVNREWEMIPFDESSKALTISDLVKDVICELNFDQARQELLNAILYGFYSLEIIWGTTDKWVVPIKLLAKHPRRFHFTPDRELRLLTLSNMWEGEPVPEKKFIIFTYGSSDNPYGNGLGQKLYWPVWFKKNSIKFWLTYLERFGQPTVIGKYPVGTSTEQQDALLDAIDAIQNETGIRIPENMDINLLEAGRSGTASYEQMCEYMDRQISKTVLGQTLTTEVDGKGSYAASQTHNTIRNEILKADADLLCECLNNSLIKWIVDYNFADKLYPKMWIRCEDDVDLTPLAQRDSIIVGMGLPVSKKYFYETYAIPKPEEGDELIGDMPNGLQQEEKRPDAAKRSAKEKPAKTEDEADEEDYDEVTEYSEYAEKQVFGFADVDRLGEQFTAIQAKNMRLILKPIIEEMKRAKDLKAAGEMITELYPKLDMRSFEMMLEQAMTLSGLTGYVSSAVEMK